MDALRQSVLRAQLAKPLPEAPRTGAQKPAAVRPADLAGIDARFAALDSKLDTLIRMLEGPGGKPAGPRRLLPADIRRTVTVFFDVADADLDQRGRRVRDARIRQIAYYLCRAYTPYSFPQIARVFHRDHATIVHGVRRVRALRKTDAALADDLSKLEAWLAGMLAQRCAAKDRSGS